MPIIYLRALKAATALPVPAHPPGLPPLPTAQDLISAPQGHQFLL